MFTIITIMVIVNTAVLCKKQLSIKIDTAANYYYYLAINYLIYYLTII